jgi:hypothetical protein
MNFDESLQNILQELFGVEIPIIYQDTRNDVAYNSIAHIIHFTSYEALKDPYSGGTDRWTVLLRNFVRPDNTEPLNVMLEYGIHDLSGQFDSWEGEVSGALETEKQIFLDYLNPNLWDFYLANYPQIKTVLNGEIILER